MMTGSQVARSGLAGGRPATMVDATKLTAFTPDDGSEPARHFDIRYSLADRYLQLRFIGIWDEAMFDIFAAAYLSAVARLNAANGITHLLVDGTPFGTQPPEVADRFPSLIGSASRLPTSARPAWCRCWSIGCRRARAAMPSMPAISARWTTRPTGCSPRKLKAPALRRMM